MRYWPSMPRTVWVIQLGNVVNFFGFGLILPFEIIYLHDHRGFSLPVAGLIISTSMAVNAAVAAPAGALVDHVGGKRLLFVGMSVCALGSGSLAFVTHPWQGFVSSAVLGIGMGLNGPSASVLMSALTTREERVAAFTVARVSINLGIGAGGVVAGFIVASGSLRSFQTLYLLNALTFLGYLAFLAFVPNARPVVAEHREHGTKRGYRAVAADRAFISIMTANLVFVMVGYTLFGYIMPPFAHHHAHLGSQAIGLVFAVNTVFIIIVQIPIAGAARGRSRVALAGGMALAWAVACIATLGAGALPSPTSAAIVFAVGGIVFGIGECLHAVVIGPLVSELAPPHLTGRYMAIMGLTFSLGLGLGPAAGATLLGASPHLPWLVGAAAMLLALPALAAAAGRLRTSAGLTAAPAAD